MGSWSLVRAGERTRWGPGLWAIGKRKWYLGARDCDGDWDASAKLRGRFDRDHGFESRPLVSREVFVLFLAKPRIPKQGRILIQTYRNPPHFNPFEIRYRYSSLYFINRIHKASAFGAIHTFPPPHRPSHRTRKKKSNKRRKRATPAGFEPALANEVDIQARGFESTALTTRPKCLNVGRAAYLFIYWQVW